MLSPRWNAPENFHWIGKCSISVGDTVVQVVQELSGALMVTAPGSVISTEICLSADGKQCTFIYVECPKRRRIEVGRLAAKIGRGARKKLRRSGIVPMGFAERLRSSCAR